MSESRPKKCSHCQKPTTLHLTKVVDGAVLKLGFCGGCPQAEALKDGVGFDLIADGGEAKMARLPSAGGVACPSCGLTPGDFKESGRLGCPRCYEVFAAKLEPLIAKLHSGLEHLGKVPQGRRREISPQRIAALKRRLKEHVSREEYELAAVVRDQLRSLES